MQTSLEYWARLQQGLSGGCVFPVFRPTSEGDEITGGEAVLGGESAWQHEPMSTPDEVRALFQRARESALLLGLPPNQAAVLGIQRLAIDRLDTGAYELRTTAYKYTIVASQAANQDGGITWSAARLESEPELGKQSWLLNHPVHHYQLGGSKDLRLPSSSGRSLISFVDAALRAYAPEAWGELYDSLYLQLTEADGCFAWLTGASSDSVPIQTQHLDRVRDTFRQARAKNEQWYAQVQQWRADVADRSVCAPELFDAFRHPEGPA